MKKKGLFITLEGPDGSGKTSALEEVMPQIRALWQGPVVFTREPGGSKIAEAIRQILLHPEFTEMDVRTEALLFAAQRRQHIVEVIDPALKEGSLVISDRYVDSSIVYQGYARNLGMEAIADLNLFATAGLSPDWTIYFDLDAEEGIRRIEEGRKGHQYDRLDQEAMTFHHRVVEGYQVLMEKNKDRVKVVDASKDKEAVAQELLSTLEDILTD